ncbi:MAG: UDP-2,4-diacetamido-2,4,6-trideoxy-beta-L-altropyranose hydrolase [Chloroflexi bacterium]|nr:UDP-2,4-diacetamido-2,4,6-trideoxy-beta-L-altropyranose hydrolase [Chloroflexota bacterium]
MDHRLLFRVDAGTGIGLGHLQRCLSLASALRAEGAECIFLTGAESSVLQKVTDAGFAAYPMLDGTPGGLEDLSQVIDLARSKGCRTVVVDSYRTDDGFQCDLMEAGLFVAAVDDLGRRACCHIVMDSSIEAAAVPRPPDSGETRFLLGPQYAALREEFWDLPTRATRSRVKEVLVTMGGADGAGLTPLVIDVLDSLEGDFAVTAIIGPFFKDSGTIEAAAARSTRGVRLVDSPDSVRDLMLEADVVVSAAGQTLYELAATGTPTIAVKVAENQSRNIRSFADRGVVVPVPFETAEQLRESLSGALRQVLSDIELRGRMSEAGRRLVDGKGARGCAGALLGADTVLSGA